MSASTRNKHSKYGNPKVDIDKEEFERIREALSQEEFRKLFFDYVDEIQDPENRRIYEEEIAELEKERGVEVTFIHPKPGFVVKTAIDGELKCFINIAISPEVERPKNEVSINPQTGERGLSWSIPMAQTPPREDCDAKNKLCKVFDVVFHPDALHLAKRNGQFRQCLIDTALDGVEREYHVKLDRANLKFPKLDYKGISRPTVIRKLAKESTAEDREPHPLEHMYPKKPEANASQPKVLPMKTNTTAAPKFTVPKYSIKHSHEVEMSEYTDELDAKLQATVPRSLVVEIELPLLSSTADCQLDVTEKSVYLLSERHGAKYRLKLDLPYKVDDKAGNARFDTEQRRLSITLPVVRSSARQQREMHDTVRLLSREDSGVELSSHSENSESPAEEEEAEVEAIELIEQQPAVDTNAFPPTVNVTPRSFLKCHLHYQMPHKFDCNVLDNVMAFVLHVPNVQPDSIETLQLSRSLHLQFASMGSGYYPTHYAILVQLLDAIDPKLHIDHVEADASDDNVVLRLYMSAGCETMPSYLAGPDSNDLKEYSLGQYTDSNGNKISNGEECGKKLLQVSMDHNEVEQAVEVIIAPPGSINEAKENEPHQEEELQQQEHLHHKKPNKKQRKRNKRSLSESACEDIKAEEHHELQQQEQQQQPKHSTPQQLEGAGGGSQPMATLKLPQRKQRSYSECNESSSSVTRGILKRFSRYGPRPSISDSCSSIDDCSSSYSCSVDAAGAGFSQSFGGIPEERGIGDDDAGLSESCKKTVRFNDHIMKQVFRLDSSILGQRKKNQKRRDCKLRAQQRRLSEGDSADYEEAEAEVDGGQQVPVHKTAGNAQYFKQQNNIRHGKDNKKQSFHDSGLDLTGGSAVKSNNNNYNEEETKRNDADAKNSMMFEMDEDDDDM